MCLYLFLAQKSLIHIPYEQLVGTPLDHGMNYEEVVLAAEDGAKIHGWFIPNPNASHVFLMFCGNAGNKSYMLDAVSMIYKLGYSVFIYDYREFGKSTGKLTEDTMYSDSELAWNYLTQTRGIPADQIVLHGRSLGVAMASWLATKTKPAALIMESGFTSLGDMADFLYKWLPAKAMLKWKYDNVGRINEVTSPILIIHSTDDELIPYSHAQRLFEEAPGTKELITLSGDHLEGYIESGAIYTNGISQFIERVSR